MEQIKINVAEKTQQDFLEKNFTTQNVTADIALVSGDFSEMVTALTQGSCEAFAFDMAKLPAVLPENVVITAVSERFSTANVILIKKGKYQADNILGLAQNAVIATEVAHLPFILQSISADFVFEKNDDVQIQPLLANQELAEDVVAVPLSAREFPTAAAHGVLAFLCHKNDNDTRRFLKQIHHSETATLTNVERTFIKLLGGEIAGAYCEKDKMDNYHLWATVVTDGELINVRASSSTTFSLAETAFAQYQNKR